MMKLMKWMMCRSHSHARVATPDALAAIPSLRIKSLCHLCNENTSSESRVSVACEPLVFGWLSL